MSSIGKKRIVGSGLIAKSLSDALFVRDTLVLASGVSNSLEVDGNAFRREIELVRNEILNYPGFEVIYFSTCSITSGIVTPYIEHKLRVECLIKEIAPSFYIWRLPQVVGVVQNTTLISSLVNSILNNKVVVVQAKAVRNLLDVADLSRILTLLVNSRSGLNTMQNLASSCNVKVTDIVDEIGRLLGCAPRATMRLDGSNQIVEIDFLRNILPEDDIVFSHEYWKRVLSHYVPIYVGLCSKLNRHIT